MAALVTTCVIKVSGVAEVPDYLGVVFFYLALIAVLWEFLHG
jgi:hypothetical protein